MLRTLENVRISDRICTKTLLQKQKMLSINQLNAQVKLTEMWKACNQPNYPLNIKQLSSTNNGPTTRGMTCENLVEAPTKGTFMGDAARLWNKAPLQIRKAKTLITVKKEIRKFCQTLPI